MIFCLGSQSEDRSSGVGGVGGTILRSRKIALPDFLEYFGKKNRTVQSFGSNVQKELRCDTKITDFTSHRKNTRKS